MKINTVWIGLDCTICNLVWFSLSAGLVHAWVGLGLVWITNYSQVYMHIWHIYGKLQMSETKLFELEALNHGG